MPKLLSSKDTQINLLPQKEFAGTFFGRVLAWIISTFRIIVIVTEILVMAAFLSRFWLDAQNTDLTESMDEKRSIIAASQDFEQQFKDTQDRIHTVSELSKNLSVSSYLSTITKSVPPDVSLSGLSKLPGELEITAVTTSERSAQQFVTNLQNSGLFNEVSLTDIHSDSENPNLIAFVIKTIPKEGGINK